MRAPRSRGSARHNREPAGRAARVEQRTGRHGALAARLEALARNLWWTWQPQAQRLFAALDPPLWDALGHNPLATLAYTPRERLDQLEHDASFLAELGDCVRRLREYLRTRTWFDRTAGGRSRRLLVAYLCAEFGLHECLPQYAGGLGVLAGDHLKSASDLGVPLVGVGLLYRCGYYRQSLLADGSHQILYPRYDFTTLPLEDSRRRVRVPLGRGTLEARIWRARVGRAELLLLDSDTPPNPPALRRVTGQLYGGDAETRIQQEILLGIGGVRALAVLGIRPTVFHLNEGHAALAGLERLRELRRRGLTLPRAIETVRRTSVFTTHTPVPAGHDRFSPALTLRYLRPLAEELGLDGETLLGLGRQNPADGREPFCMTVLALRLSAHCNAVSELHGRTTRRMWMAVYGAHHERDVPIGHVTNGVHVRTWLAPEMAELCERYLGRPAEGAREPGRLGPAAVEDYWKRAARIPPEELWAVRNALRARLVQFVRRRLVEQVQRRLGSEPELRAARRALDERALTIGFARRFATYKRATLVFHNPQRLAAILNHPERPVQLVFAGKAHPRDLPGQALAKRIFRLARRPEFRGRVVLLEDYDMELGRVLTSGCDVWLNTPLRPQEASGTSGMKPALNGGLNCSILDGWWPEGFNGRNGWKIGDTHERRSRREQDHCDAASLYERLEREIVPLFYRRDGHGLPRGWIRRIIESLRTIPGRFNSHRMVAEYWERFYRVASE